MNDPRELAALRRARGRAFDTVGDFDSARADYEAVVALARAAGDPRGELEGLLDLGALWAGRDYQQVGEHLQRALDLARDLGDPALLGESLNRLGNWQANTAQPREALPLHREALALFEQIGDRRGIATTLDLLGMASFLSADLDESMTHFDRAAALFRLLDDRVGLVSTLAMLSSRAGTYELGTMTSDAAAFEAAFRAGEEAAQLAREIGWPAGEAFTVLQLAVALGLRGDYARALHAAERGLRIAEEIEHGEWMADAHCTYGQLYLDLLILPKARTHLERSLALAREVRSDFWIRLATACLAWATIAEGDFPRTVALLGPLPPGDAPVRSLAERWMVFGHAQLALARRQPELALHLSGRLDAPPLDGSAPRLTPRPALIRVEALIALGRLDEAEAVLATVREVVQRQQTRPQIWRVHLLSGSLYRAQQRAEDAQREFSAARAQIEEIAADLPSEELRDEFLQGATARLPRPYRLSQRRAESARFGGLTAREREVATMVARGLSNREIADALVLGERTIETHVSNVLAKLGLTSRREIARWARERGLNPEAD